ncbi:SAM-dependent methyltransferase [Qaidamihabitans albus]|uniref:SAM-dependent methyltransferase n=1 Tax=Qaidamihabitans albus TaxID=2795733 RepID=UPI0018F2364A|nr:class I SAM-dependent methyltransferase [Qaidamihabitans albus]
MRRTELAEHPDRRRWNTRYLQRPPTFEPHPLVDAALAAGCPTGPVLELACGRSGSALALAATGRRVVAVDIADLALTQLTTEARRRGLAELIEPVAADVPAHDPGTRCHALVLATSYWDATAFRSACAAVLPGGLIGWEALADSPETDRPERPWHVRHGELSTRLPGGFEVLAEELIVSGRRRSTRLLARAGSADTSTQRADTREGTGG